MKRPGRIAILVLALLAWVALVPKACAQVMLPHRHAVSVLQSATWNPTNIVGIRYYWVASDLLTNATVTNWIDRIQGLNVGQATGANRPTNSTSGVHFTGSPRCMSNAVTVGGFVSLPSITGSVFVVVAPVTPAQTLGAILGSGTGSWGVYAKSNGKFHTYGQHANSEWGSYSSGTMLDFAAIITNDIYATHWYLNGSLVITNTTSLPAEQEWFGRDSTGNYGKCYLQEVAYFSNVLTTSDIARLHNYATNRYGYTP